jgi:hypothetical protein
MCPQVRLPFIPSGFLNTANSPVQTGQFEPITGIELPSGISPGAWFDMTESEAQAYSSTNAALQQLHCGRYQWVQLASSAVITGNGKLQLGQALFAVPSSVLPPSYVVTNVPPNATSFPASHIFINTLNTGPFPVTPGNWFFAQVIAPGRATVLLAATQSAGAFAIGDTIAGRIAGFGGVDAGLWDDIQDFSPTTSTGADIFSGVGVAETLPAASALIVIDINRAGPFIQ